MRSQLLVFVALILGLSACSTVYYGTLEKIGIHKRDIMVDRVKAARAAQNEAQQQFLTAMEQFRGVVPGMWSPLFRSFNRLISL